MPGSGYLTDDNRSKASYPYSSVKELAPRPGNWVPYTTSFQLSNLLFAGELFLEQARSTTRRSSAF